MKMKKRKEKQEKKKGHFRKWSMEDF